MIIAITKTTTRIPTHTPALKISPITWHELNVNNNKVKINNKEDNFFIFGNLQVYMQKYCHGNVGSKS